jgi:hypothetical protein
MKSFVVTGNFWVGEVGFATFFTGLQKSNPGLFPHKLNVEGYEHFMYHLKVWSSKRAISLNEFLGVFLAIYQETGGKFESIAEYGSKEYFDSKPYGYKARGRGYIQVTWDYNYRLVLSQLGYNYDALSSEELDELFAKNSKVAFGSVRIMLLEEKLLKKAYEGLATGNFSGFGTRLNGSPAYGQELENRALYILKAMDGKKLQNSIFLRNKDKIYKGIAIGACVLAFSLMAYAVYRNRQ